MIKQFLKTLVYDFLMITGALVLSLFVLFWFNDIIETHLNKRECRQIKYRAEIWKGYAITKFQSADCNAVGVILDIPIVTK